MRLIVVGCEYSGVTTLIDGLMEWGHARGIHHHLDDHFAIPDSQHVSEADAKQMLALSPLLKERFQRMQVVYHIRLMHRYDHILLGGFHIEEEIYGPLYYYPDTPTIGVREYEAEMPEDTILVHLKARPEVIEARMASAPHDFTTVKREDIPMLLARFEQQVRTSWIKHKFAIDTSDLTPDQLLATFLEQSIPHLSTRDLLTRFAETGRLGSV